MSGARYILAPHIWPAEPLGGFPADSPGRVFYLSWPGWELYLNRRLGLKAAPNGPRPLMLPDHKGAEADFLALDQIYGLASQMGAGLLNLAGDSPESLPALLASIRTTGRAAAPFPALDDRLYLALWATAEYQIRQSDELLRQAAQGQRRMWAALKGAEEPAEPAPVSPPAPGDPRSEYAWRLWRRLATPLVGPEDVILATAAEL